MFVISIKKKFFFTYLVYSYPADIKWNKVIPMIVYFMENKKINAQKLKRGKKKENPNAQQALSSGDIFQSYLLLL